MRGKMSFKKLDEGFVCDNCKKVIKPLGYSSRNHCPFCLHSKHVDINPGDRLNNCKGKMQPFAIENSSKKGYIIVHKCMDCGEIKRNKSAKDDDFELMLRINSNLKY